MATALDTYNAAIAAAKADYDAAKPATAKATAHETLRAYADLMKCKRAMWARVSLPDRAAHYNLAPRILMDVAEDRLSALRVAFESRDYDAAIFAVCRADLSAAALPAGDTAGYDTSIYEAMREREGGDK